jgi:hypothetical protein
MPAVVRRERVDGITHETIVSLSIREYQYRTVDSIKE